MVDPFQRNFFKGGLDVKRSLIKPFLKPFASFFILFLTLFFRRNLRFRFFTRISLHPDQYVARRACKKMRDIYWIWIFLVIFLIFLVIISVTTSFSVPENVERIPWLRENKRPEIATIFGICLILLLLTWVSYLINGRVKFEAPLSQPTIFLLSIAFLLLSNFFVTHDSTTRHTYDAHPILFYVTIFLLIVTVLTGIICTVKIFENRV